jgi:hypothetical protein
MRLSSRTLSAALTALLIAAPAATARPAGTPAHLAGSAAATTSQDLRSPDARDAAAATTTRDLRSPDARDAAEGRGTYNSPDVVIVKVPQPSPATAPGPSSAGGIDWTAAGIGAGSLLGLSLIALGGALVIVHRRRPAHDAPPVAGL